jgi:hypothetical protein
LFDVLKGLHLIRECDRAHNGDIRLMTLFEYPDGSNVDVFVEYDVITRLISVTDHGNTLAYLCESGAEKSESLRVKEAIERESESGYVSHTNGVLSVVVGLGGETLPSAILRLCHACVRIRAA